MGVQNNDSQMNDLALPSFKEVFANPKAPEDVHVAISKTQVFRADDSERDFTELKDMKMDSLEDMHQFYSEIQKKQNALTKDMRFIQVQQLITQEQGERFFNEQKERKLIQETELVEDELHRELLKQKIEYFQIGSANREMQGFKHFESKWQRDERARMEKRQTHQNQKRIVCYTFNYPSEMTKQKIWRLLNCSKYGSDKKPGIEAASPIKGGRPRANSQENILQINDEGNQKSNLLENSMIV